MVGKYGGNETLTVTLLETWKKNQNKAVKILKFERNSPNLSTIFNDLGIMKFRYSSSEQLYICS